jgi:hypothetical protein
MMAADPSVFVIEGDHFQRTPFSEVACFQHWPTTTSTACGPNQTMPREVGAKSRRAVDAKYKTKVSLPFA